MDTRKKGETYIFLEDAKRRHPEIEFTNPAHKIEITEGAFIREEDYNRLVSKNFYIADTHFGHQNCIKFDERPFKSVDEMDSEIIKRWNEVVTEEDHVYILGDFMFKSKYDISSYTKQLNGHLHLIWGNHDRKNEHYQSCFETTDECRIIEDTVYGQKRQVILSHYWIPFAPYQRYGAFMLHGHTHISKEHILDEEMKQNIRDNGIRCESYNVGCMFQNYYPQTLEQIIERQKRDIVF